MRYTLSVNYSGSDDGGSDEFDSLAHAMTTFELHLEDRHPSSHKQVVLTRHYDGYDMVMAAETVPALWVIDQVEG